MTLEFAEGLISFIIIQNCVNICRYKKYAYPYGKQIWMDPGASVVQNHTYDVIMDVIARYHVDGVHWDDYFYPYPVQGQSFPDENTYEAYKSKGGVLSLGDWRRNNINTLVQRVYKGIKSKKKLVKFGISPSGLYKPGKPGGMPPPITGFDQYDETYADPKLWLQQGWVDYLTPQIYWKIAPPHQSYPKVLEWWLKVNIMRRHIYAGNGVYRLESADGGWEVSEIQRQIDISRSLSYQMSLGNVLFTAHDFRDNVKNVSDIFQMYVYQNLAIIPYMPWLHN